MAQLPPDGTWLVQQIDDDVIVFHRYTEEEIVKFKASDGDAASRAQQTIFLSEKLNGEQKSFAHFWSGYFYAYATSFSSEASPPLLPLL